MGGYSVFLCLHFRIMHSHEYRGKKPLVFIWPKANFCQSLKHKNVVKHQALCAQRSCQF